MKPTTAPEEVPLPIDVVYRAITDGPVHPEAMRSILRLITREGNRAMNEILPLDIGFSFEQVSCEPGVMLTETTIRILAKMLNERGHTPLSDDELRNYVRTAVQEARGV